jgi:hypothetical protein
MADEFLRGVLVANISCWADCTHGAEGSAGVSLRTNFNGY